VKQIWQNEPSGTSPLQKWQFKIQKLRQFRRGWAKNTSGTYKKEKGGIIKKADKLDKKVETQMLSAQEIDLKQCLKQRLTQLLREEELKWYQRAKTTKLLQGDCNTKYFQLVAIGKNRRTRIFQLEQEEGIIEGDENLKRFITNHYKRLFGASERNSFTMIESERDDIPQVTELENEILVSSFMKEEVKKAIFQMEHNKAPGPDGFPAEFYKVFWDLIKDDLLSLFHEFHKVHLPLFSLNFRIITLHPKQKKAKQIQQFRPICLLNVSFKSFTKVMENRVALVAQKVIKPSQTAFMTGRAGTTSVVPIGVLIRCFCLRNLK
jgi:mannosylglycoprotein endo-beta-mannosidase